MLPVEESRHTQCKLLCSKGTEKCRCVSTKFHSISKQDFHISPNRIQSLDCNVQKAQIKSAVKQTQSHAFLCDPKTLWEINIKYSLTYSLLTVLVRHCGCSCCSCLCLIILPLVELNLWRGCLNSRVSCHYRQCHNCDNTKPKKGLFTSSIGNVDIHTW